jgi:glucose/arabinose dehydrogenase
MAFDDSGNLLVTDKSAGKIYLLKDSDNNGVVENAILIDEGLTNPHGIDFYNGDLYIGETHQVVVYKDWQQDGRYSSKQVLIPDLPTGGHNTRTVVIGPDNYLYVSIGSSCNVCEEVDERRAAIVKYNLEGENEEIFAKGLRNTVGFVFKDRQIWGVDNGRDLLGDDLPVEEVNIIELGRFYGWPFCHGAGIYNPEYPEKEEFCLNNSESPTYEMQAHSAPLGLRFFPEDLEERNFPQTLKENLFIAFHGSWNRTVPTGYKIVRIDTSNEEANTIDFITGWILPDGSVWGRPVDVIFDDQGIMYISDDYSGTIYRVEYKD